MSDVLEIDAFVLGAPKCGTTWLSNILEQHPEVCISNPKEPNVIATHKGTMIRDNSEPNYSKYSKYFQGPGKKIDCSVHAFACPEAPSRIKKRWPSAKFILCVREPISRTISHWKMIRETEEDIHSGADWSNFETAWADPRLHMDTLYGSCLKNWLEEFPRESILIINSEVMRDGPSKTLELICKHLEISSFNFDYEKISESNKSEDRKKSTIFGRRIMKISSLMPNIIKSPIVFPLKKFGINIYNSKALTTDPVKAEIDIEKASKIIMPQIIDDIILFEDLSGEKYPKWR